MKMPAWLPRALIIANVMVLLALALFGVDTYVRWRILQAVNNYHANIIIPMTTPRPAPPTK